MQGAEGEEQRLRQAEEAEHLHHLRLECGHRLAERGVVVRLDPLEIVEAGDERMVVNSVEHQAPYDIAALLLEVHAVQRSEHAHHVAAQLQVVHHGLAPQVQRARVMRRVEVVEHEHFHRAQRRWRTRERAMVSWAASWNRARHAMGHCKNSRGSRVCVVCSNGGARIPNQRGQTPPDWRKK
jgi:hypothetical protein